jgi:hypothetical protein
MKKILTLLTLAFLCGGSVANAIPRRGRQQHHRRPTSQQWCFDFEMEGLNGTRCFSTRETCIVTREAEMDFTMDAVAYTPCNARPIPPQEEIQPMPPPEPCPQ